MVTRRPEVRPCQSGNGLNKDVEVVDQATIPYPDGIARFLGVSTWTVRQMRARGDCPRLFSITSRILVTTEQEIITWLEEREVPAHYKQREPTRGSGRAAHDRHRQLMSIDGGKS